MNASYLKTMHLPTPVRVLLGAAAFAVVLLAGPSDGFAAGLPAGKEFTNPLGIKFVRIAPGEFVMGSGESPPRNAKEWESRDWDESPAHQVKISKPFFLGACEITNAQYEQFDPEHRKLRGRQGASKTDDEPVTFVTWQRATDYCRWLSQNDGKPYRLPTEAEWEYACRAGTTTAYNTGDTLTADQANFGVARDGRKGITTVPVGSYQANAWGLHDMHGNVAEWCLDWYGPYAAGKQSDPVGRADGYARVTRGWSFLPATHPRGAVRYCRSANRSGHLPEDANCCTGFRVAMGDVPAEKPLPVVAALCQKDVKQSPRPPSAPIRPGLTSLISSRRARRPQCREIRTARSSAHGTISRPCASVPTATCSPCGTPRCRRKAVSWPRPPAVCGLARIAGTWPPGSSACPTSTATLQSF